SGGNQDSGPADLPLLRPGLVLIGFSDPLSAGSAGTPGDTSRELARRGVTSFAMELMPRITRAQSMDALSAMATVAGYKAVVLAAGLLPRMFPMLMTAAGTLVPARVLIIGAGVAGLQAIATARRLGAVVSAYDVRPAVKEQVESVGAKFVSVELDSSGAEDRGGYAKEMGEEFNRRLRERLAGVLAESDVVVATAAVPGRRAPILITRAMVGSMAPGSVIVDVAAERGGNCELTRPGETVTEGGVTIAGPLNLPGTVPYHASQMYARNIATFLVHLIHDGRLAIDRGDEITRETLVTQGGEVVHPRVRQLLGEAPLPETGEAGAVPVVVAGHGAPAATSAHAATGTTGATGTSTGGPAGGR
ncbi:MAG: NAD(P) transhydrogenase subunit alpha, partial [Acidobacteriota bacterium]|nr:NAD(P) transhydrogenase subunit alpha [Acidobacteriota bacterium]